MDPIKGTYSASQKAPALRGKHFVLITWHFLPHRFVLKNLLWICQWCNTFLTYLAGEVWWIHAYLTASKVSKYGVFSGPYSVRMREKTDQKKLRVWTLFTQCLSLRTYIGLLPVFFRTYSLVLPKLFHIQENLCLPYTGWKGPKMIPKQSFIEFLKNLSLLFVFTLLVSTFRFYVFLCKTHIG